MKDGDNKLKIKRGYLNKDFELFHLKDKKTMEFEFHYHEFNKIIIFISGNVTYLIEGKAYKLKPWDILFVSSNDVHKAVISHEETYERIIIWVNSRFLEMHNREGSDLLTCFEISSKKNLNLLRINDENMKSVKYTLFLLRDATKDKNFGSYILKNSLFIELMVYLNRLCLGSNINNAEKDIEYDKEIENILRYINENLIEDLSIDNIASEFYMNKYYLMHKFKDKTGCTLHSYIQKKRLLLARDLIKKGKKITQVSAECGFGDYSSFVRAFKKAFGVSPKEYKDYLL